jgi:divalent metal cation (Fe/Co/Zn/Cd) transporter
VDLHVQFRPGTSLEDAHKTAHELQDVISSRLSRSDVLIHLEPADRVRPGENLEHRVGSPDLDGADSPVPRADER